MSNHQTKRVGLVALALLGALGVGCGKGGRASKNPTQAQQAAMDPTKASAEAKAAFSKVYDRYASATAGGGKLAASQCEQLANDFTAVFRKFGKQMTVAYFNAGAIWHECGQPEKAEAIYDEIIKKVPQYDLAYNNLGVIYWNRKQEGQALHNFREAVKAKNITTAARNNLAAALRNQYSERPDQGDFEKAQAELQNVLAVDSGNPMAYENLARLYYDRGRLKDKSYLLLANLVVQQAMRVLKEQDVESADLYNIKGLLLMEEDNQVDALKAFQKATELEPNHTDAHMNMAMIALRFRAFQQAQKSLNVALRDRRQKKNIETYLGLGVAERGLRKYKEAEAAFKKAMEMGGGDPRPLYNLGILYQEHIAPSLEQYSEKPYDTAKEYFDRFTSKAGGNKAHQEAVADAKARIAAINQLKADMREMKELERKQKELEAQQKREEAAERKRLLELEQKAKASSAPPPAASPPAADNKGKKKK